MPRRVMTKAHAQVKHAREQRTAQLQRWYIIGRLADDTGLGCLGLDTMREVFVWVMSQVPAPLLGHLACPAGGTHAVQPDPASNTLVCAKCHGVLMVVAPAPPAT